MKKLMTFLGTLLLVGLLGVVVLDVTGRLSLVDMADDLGVSSALGLDAHLVSTVVDDVEAEPVRTGFSYSLLSEQQKGVYAALFRACEKRLESFDCRIEELDDIEPALVALLEDHPEFFWLAGSCEYSRPVGTKRSHISLVFDIDPSQIDERQALIDAACADFATRLPEGAGAYDVLKAAYEYVITTTDYSYQSTHNQNIQSVFIDHQSVCAGYARALQYLLQRYGIDCAFVTGSISAAAEDHAWNLVWLDGVPTYVDVTWGDPTYSGPRGEDVEGTLTYDYLCLTTEEMVRDGHAATHADALPSCTSTDYDYYRLNGRYFDVYSYDQVNGLIAQAMAEGQTSFAVKFGNDDAYAQALADLEDHAFLRGAFQDLAISRGETVSRHSYAVSDALRIIRFFWD